MPSPPLWVLRHTILPYGARLQKNRPKWEPPKPVYVPPKREPTWTQNGEIWKWNSIENKAVKVGPAKQTILHSLPGNLDKSEYFLWIGKRYLNAREARCRACGHVTNSESERRQHKNGCGKVLVKVYDMLRRDKAANGGYLCAVCNTSTPHLCWAVPLCNGCVDTWKFGMLVTGEIPGIFTAALDKAKLEMGLL